MEPLEKRTSSSKIMAEPGRSSSIRVSTPTTTTLNKKSSMKHGGETEIHFHASDDEKPKPFRAPPSEDTPHNDKNGEAEESDPFDEPFLLDDDDDDSPQQTPEDDGPLDTGRFGQTAPVSMGSGVVDLATADISAAYDKETGEKLEVKMTTQNGDPSSRDLRWTDSTTLDNSNTAAAYIQTQTMEASSIDRVITTTTTGINANFVAGKDTAKKTSIDDCAATEGGPEGSAKSPNDKDKSSVKRKDKSAPAAAPPTLGASSSDTCIKQGSRLPCVRVSFQGQLFNIQEYFCCRRGIIIGLPGVFTPTRMQGHMKEFFADADELKEWVDYIGCIVVNDPYTIKAWSRSTRFDSKISFICDPECRLTKKLGVEIDYHSLGMGMRCRKFVAIIREGAVVEWVGLGDNDTSSKVVLKELEECFGREKCTYAKHGGDWTCAWGPGMVRQSPIALLEEDVVMQPAHEVMPFSIIFKYNQPLPPMYFVRKWGGIVKVMSATTELSLGRVIVDREEFVVSHIEVHSPSEHTFNGAEERRACEIQIYHKPAVHDTTASRQPHRIVAVSVTFEPAVDDTPNPFLAAILPLLQTCHEAVDNSDTTPQPHFVEVPASDLTTNPLVMSEALFAWGTDYEPPLRLDSSLNLLESVLPFEDEEEPQFYRYHGSATTPPCAENVTWFVKRDGEPASAVQLELMADLLKSKDDPHAKGNYRELQNVEPNNNFKGDICLVRGIRSK